MAGAAQAQVADVGMPQVVRFTPPRTVAPFLLMDHQSDLFTEAELRGRWTIAYFGYLSCPDACPTTLHFLHRAAVHLRAQAAGVAPWQFLFVSVDPHRDMPANLREFVAAIDREFIGVTGPLSELDPLVQACGVEYDYGDLKTGEVFYDASARPPDDDYVVNHSNGLMLIDPAGRAVAQVVPPMTLEGFLAALAQLRAGAAP